MCAPLPFHRWTAVNASTGSFTATLSASALVSGVQQTRTAQITVNVQSATGITDAAGLEPGEKTEIWYFDGSPMNLKTSVDG